MDNNLLSLSKIFTERIFRIPDYQRGFAWTRKHLKDFWNDLVILEEGKNHYTGVLTLEPIPDIRVDSWEDDKWIIQSKSYIPYYIVDGQQRITTAIILIQAILNTIDNRTNLNYSSKYDIQRKYIFDSKNGGISRSYIFGYEKDNPSYNFLKTEIFEEEKYKNYTKEETIYTNNLENAKLYFSQELKKLSNNKIELLFKKLTQNFLFNIYSISQEIDVFVAFETMNNRGKPLSHLELLKNRLIFLSTKFDNEEETEKTTLRNRINECWKAIYHNLGRNKQNPLDDDTFLVNHFMIYFGSELFYDDENDFFYLRTSRMKRFYRDEYSTYLLEQKFTTKNLQASRKDVTIREMDKYVKNLQESVVSWFDIFNPNQSNYHEEIKYWLDKINRLGILDVAPLIMVYFQKERGLNKKIYFLKQLEKILFISNFPGANNYPQPNSVFFLEIAVRVNEKNIPLDKISRFLVHRINSMLFGREYLNRTKKEFKNNGFYGWKGIRYFLYEYDLHLSEGAKTERKKLKWEEFSKKDYETVEHIYPKNARKDCWISEFKQFNSKEKRIIRNSLGNLLPLSRQKNASLSNKCFIDKIGRSGSRVGYRFGCYAENEVTEYNNWNAITIRNRGLSLLEFMEQRWDFRIGTIKEKMEFLNLEFLENRNL